MKSLEECQNEYAKFFTGTDFGSTDYVTLVLRGLQKVACGWANGSTMETILLEMGLIERRSDDVVLTDVGLEEMYALKAFDQTILVSKALDEIRALKAENEKLEKMIHMGIGFEDLIDDTKYGAGLEKYPTYLELQAEVGRLKDENKQVWNKWLNLSSLVLMMIRKKDIAAVQKLAQDGRHLIYSNVLRGNSSEGVEDEKGLDK